MKKNTSYLKFKSISFVLPILTHLGNRGAFVPTYFGDWCYHISQTLSAVALPLGYTLQFKAILVLFYAWRIARTWLQFSYTIWTLYCYLLSPSINYGGPSTIRLHLLYLPITKILTDCIIYFEKLRTCLDVSN